jgi:predicted glycogen debranching enzyme
MNTKQIKPASTMSFIHFTKDELQLDDFSFRREYLLAYQTGAYCSSSLANCNTRKYHGMLVVEQPHFKERKFVLLSGLDEVVTQKENVMPLGTHQYPFTMYPEGYRATENFSYQYVPRWEFKVGNIHLVKEILLVENEDRVLIRYTVVDAKQGLFLRFDPLLAFREIHSISKANNDCSKKTEAVENGIKVRMYPGFSSLFLQFSKKANFIPAPDWNYNNE